MSGNCAGLTPRFDRFAEVWQIDLSTARTRTIFPCRSRCSPRSIAPAGNRSPHREQLWQLTTGTVPYRP